MLPMPWRAYISIAITSRPQQSQPRARFARRAASCVVSMILACGGASDVSAQTAHFSGAQWNTAGNGAAIQSIAVDAKGDVYYVAVGGYLSANLRSNVAGAASSSSSTGTAVIATFSGSTATYILSGFSAPASVAVDKTGNLFVLDNGTGILGKIAAVNGSIPASVTPTIVPVATGFTTAGLMAFDANGNLFITTTTGGIVKEILAVNGGIPASPSIVTAVSGFQAPAGIAVDSAGNLYISDLSANTVSRVQAVNGSIPASPTVVKLGSGFKLPFGLSVDASGNIYVADTGNNLLKVLAAINGVVPASPTIVSVGRFTSIEATFLDAFGNLYVGYGPSSTGTIAKVAPWSANFGQVAVGATSAAVPLVFTFDTAGTLGSVSVLTQGITGLDFAGSGTCSANTAYSAGQTCSVSATFTPRSSGTRSGAVVLRDTSGKAIATGFLSGIGVGPQVAFLPATTSTLLNSGLFVPAGLAVDGSGNLYVADTGNARVVKITPPANGSTISTVATGLTGSAGLAVDGAGTIYIADSGNNRVLKQTPSAAGGYTQTTLGSGLGAPVAVAADTNGNIYIANQQSGAVVRETLLAGQYVQSTVLSGLAGVSGLAADPNGNLYLVDASNSRVVLAATSPAGYTQSTVSTGEAISPVAVVADAWGNIYIADSASGSVLKETPALGANAERIVATGLPFAGSQAGLAIDGKGNLYLANSAANSVMQFDLADAPSLVFASTAAGIVSLDSPQTVTLENLGNASLVFPVPSTGVNPAIAANFSVDTNAANACPSVGSAFLAPEILAANASCDLALSFDPASVGSMNGSLVITDNNLNASAPAYTSQVIALSGTATQPVPVIAWAAPANITYGTPLDATQLNATASMPGTFQYSPVAGTILNAGGHTLTVTFTPSDTTIAAVTQDVQILVSQATPSITWASPAAIVYGTPLSATQLNAVSTVAGTFTYAPLAGVILDVGTQTLTVAFTPTDTANYTAASQRVQLVVNQAPQSITFVPLPASLPFSASPLALVAAGGGSGAPVVFSVLSGPATIGGNVLTLTGIGTVVVAANQAGNANYLAAPTVTQSLTVTKATPVITWASPAPIPYGIALSAAQLNAAANVPGTFAYSPVAGKVLNVGTQTLTVVFTPTDTTDYTTATATVLLTVNKATPVITWATPAAITYGVALSSTQLNAKASVGGSFVYSPSAGTVLNAGTQTLTATFTPSNTASYTTAAASVQLTVNQAAQTISFPQPTSPVKLSVGQVTLSATASSGLAVAFSVVSGPATVSGTTLQLTGKGTVVVAASQSGNANYKAASQVTRSITVK